MNYPKEEDFRLESENWSYSYHGRRSAMPSEDLYRKIKVLEERLNIMMPTQEQFDKYPMLKIAFEEYQIIKKLTIG